MADQPRTITHTVPELERHCGSWIVVSNKTGLSVFETYQRSVAEKVNTERYTVLTTLQYLSRLNRLIAAGSTIANTI